MAGKRRKTGKPTLRRARMERLRQRLLAELAATSHPADRVAAAADYVRAALYRYLALDAAERVVEDLIAAGDRICREGKESHRDRDRG